MMPTSPAGYASMEAKRRRDREEAERKRRAENSAPAYSAPVADNFYGSDHSGSRLSCSSPVDQSYGCASSPYSD